MKTLLILGAGTAGTMMANHLRRKLPESAWSIRMIDQNPDHYYQPGFLFIPFGIYSEKDVIKPEAAFCPTRRRIYRGRNQPDRSRLKPGPARGWNVRQLMTS